jgi:hypothetical protein
LSRSFLPEEAIWPPSYITRSTCRTRSHRPCTGSRESPAPLFFTILAPVAFAVFIVAGLLLALGVANLL